MLLLLFMKMSCVYGTHVIDPPDSLRTHQIHSIGPGSSRHHKLRPRITVISSERRTTYSSVVARHMRHSSALYC